MSSELKPYARYKDSGVEWLGEVPGHWDVCPLKYCFEPITESGHNELIAITLESIEGWTGKLLGFVDQSVSDGTPFRHGDVLFGKLRPYLCKVWVADRSGKSIGDFYVIRPKDLVASAFGGYYLREQGTISVLNSNTYGAKMPRVGWNTFGTLPILIPPLPEQHAVADYLDAATGRVDTLISEQRELIDLLKEKRQALISNCATRGLDPDVPMKDSGVEWLGEVPEHWEAVPLGLLCDYYSYGFTNPMPTTDDGPPMITAADIMDGKVQIDSARRTTWAAFNDSLTPKSRPQSSDVLVTKDGTLGRVALAPEEPHCINQSVALFRVSQGRVLPKFIKRVLESEQAQAKMELDAGGTGIKHIYITRLSKQKMPLPPLPEQTAIADYLDTETARIDALITEAEETISLMQEHRSALISACVTGKVRVPGVADPAAEEQTA